MHISKVLPFMADAGKPRASCRVGQRAGRSFKRGYFSGKSSDCQRKFLKLSVNHAFSRFRENCRRTGNRLQPHRLPNFPGIPGEPPRLCRPSGSATSSSGNLAVREGHANPDGSSRARWSRSEAEIDFAPYEDWAVAAQVQRSSPATNSAARRSRSKTIHRSKVCSNSLRCKGLRA